MDSLKKLFFLFSMISLLSCSEDNSVPKSEQSDDEPVSEIESREAITGKRIAWDFNTKTLISGENDIGYNGYPRLIELQDESLLVVYESKGDVLVKKSIDSGKNWSDPIIVVENSEGVNMATPDVLQMQNGSILVMYNPRPGESAPPTKKFLIKTILSNDNGLSWQNDQIVYEGDTEFENGVWEPTALQLPDGEIQLFFSNENIYRDSNEQNISMLRSENNGIMWTEPEIVSYRPGSRDGMPSPLYLNDQNEIILALEDNGSNNQFKPYIIRNSVSENWSQTVGGNSENRNYALKEQMEDFEYAGAPYLAQLHTGETLLSYQGTDRRNGNDLNNSDMKVAIGNENGKDFNRVSTPFLIPEGKSALWNSITVLDDNSIIALTTTNAFSASNASEVWLIKGRVIPELEAKKASLEIDGETTEDIWLQTFPVFIGQQSSTQLLANVSVDDENLYVLSKILDVAVSTISQNIANNDGMVIYLDPYSKNLVKPSAGIFKIIVSADNQVKAYEGKDSKWREFDLPNIQTEAIIKGEGYIQEISIPWDALGGKPASNSQIGFNIELIEKGNSNYVETISATDPEAPYTWLNLKI